MDLSEPTRLGLHHCFGGSPTSLVLHNLFMFAGDPGTKHARSGGSQGLIDCLNSS